MSQTPPSNHLLQETSPYLQQHAHNPVQWYPWGAEALDKARKEDKPILLSIGYSACHWCHVMAHESFEDADTAHLMNELFVNIKVDREERPDLDQIYQTAHGLLAQRGGGWPLTVFLMPDQTPFFAGTYFPKTARYGMPAFRDLLAQVATAYRTQRMDIERQNEGIRAALARTQPQAHGAPGIALTPAPLDHALRDLKDNFDEHDGGLGDAPKFPHAVEFGFVLRQGRETGDAYAVEGVMNTLDHMAAGGIYDQLGGGFYRYSVDREWAIPHFEKMLYDNALLLVLYSDAYSSGVSPERARRYEQIVAETAGWVMREMQHAEGGYFSALDADSDHEEGAYYVWTPDSARAVLSEAEYEAASRHYGLNARANFEHAHWHLHVVGPLAETAGALDITPEAAETLLASARAKLLQARSARNRPGLDDKVLTAWNALMIRGMARAARVFNRADWLASARDAADFLRARLWREGRLLATWKDGQARHNAYLDDHAFLLEALLELLQAEFRGADLEWAQALAELLLDQFEDKQHGGFYFTSHDHEALILRMRTGHDGAQPAGNGVAAQALQRLGHVLGEARYLEAAERTLRAFRPQLERLSSGHASLCLTLDEHLAPPTVAVLRGDADACAAWRRAVAARYLPHVLLLDISGMSEPDTLPAALAPPAAATAAAASAWICRGTQCLPPLHDLNALLEALSQRIN